MPSHINDGAPLLKQPTLAVSAPPQNSDWIPYVDSTRGAVNLGGGWTGSAWHWQPQACFVVQGHQAAQWGKYHGHIFTLKINKYNVKSLIYNAYTIQSFCNVSVLNIFPYDWYSLTGRYITRKFCVLRKNQTFPRLRGIVASITEAIRSDQ